MMESSQINEENSSDCNADDGSNAGSSYTCEMCQNVITDNRELTEMMEVQQESIDCEIAENRKRELDGIQEDLNNLIGSVNNFITDNLEEYDSEGEPENDEETDEKKDGPQEKELKKMGKICDEIYTSDGLNPPEINWNHLAPILQKHVTDLKRLQNLNTLTNSVMQRIKKISQLKQAIKELEEKQH